MHAVFVDCLLCAHSPTSDCGLMNWRFVQNANLSSLHQDVLGQHSLNVTEMLIAEN
jgi:hypothetical protein